MLLINPNVGYESISTEQLFRTDDSSINADITFDSKVNQYKVILGKTGKHIHIRKWIYNTAQSLNQLIAVNEETGKLRRMAADDVNANDKKTQSVSESFDPNSIEVETTRLKDINFDPRLFVPIKTGTYIDEFVSYKGGFMPGINIMLTGDPGVGKSSNLMDILVNIKRNDPDKKVLYVSAEMNEIDVKEFEQYYPGLENIDFLYIGNYVTDPDSKIKPYQALMAVLNKGWDMVVMDSLVEVQSMIQEDLELPAKKAEKWMLDLMKTHNSGHNNETIYTAFLCIQQKNKGGSYVGSKRLEHMTSAFLNLCWDPKEKGKRYMIFEKNRKGKEKVKLYYGFAAKGGIKYDTVRHTTEQDILQRMQEVDDAKDTFETITNFDFESLFRASLDEETNS